MIFSVACPVLSRYCRVISRELGRKPSTLRLRRTCAHGCRSLRQEWLPLQREVVCASTRRSLCYNWPATHWRAFALATCLSTSRARGHNTCVLIDANTLFFRQVWELPHLYSQVRDGSSSLQPGERLSWEQEIPETDLSASNPVSATT